MISTNYIIIGCIWQISVLLTGVSGVDPVISPYPVANAVEGKNLTLHCTYSGAENVTACAWQRGEHSIGTIRSTCLPFGGFDDNLYAYDCPSQNVFTWTIKNITKAEHGYSWTCYMVFNSKFHPALPTTVYVAVGIQAVVLTSPTQATVTVIENTKHEFVCETSKGRPSASIRWYLDDRNTTSAADDVEITSGVSTATRAEGELNITIAYLLYRPTRDVNNWKVYCTASNIHGQLLTSAHQPTFYVQYPPSELSLIYSSYSDPFININSVKVVRGDDVQIECLSNGDPEPSFTWSGQTESSPILTITNIQTDTTRACTATNTMTPTAGNSITSSATKNVTIIVMYKATIISFIMINHEGSATVTVEENDNVSFQCLVDSNPGSTIQISKDGNEKKTGFETNKEAYELVRATCLDAGLYTCTGFNEYNQIEEYPLQVLQLYVLCSPRPSDKVQSNITIAIHGKATLSVTIVAYPVPSSYVWSKLEVFSWTDLNSSSDILISSKGLQSNLTIVDMEQSGYGQYKVTVNNTVGMFQQLFYVIQQDEPDSVHEEPLSSAAIGGIAGGLLVLVLVVLGVILARKYQLGICCKCNNKGGTRNDVPASRDAKISTQQDTNTLDPVTNLNVTDLSDPSTQYTELTVRDSSTNAYDMLDNIDPDTNLNAAELSDPSAQFTTLTDRDSSTNAYDMLDNIELEESQPSRNMYENLNI